MLALAAARRADRVDLVLSDIHGVKLPNDDNDSATAVRKEVTSKVGKKAAGREFAIAQQESDLKGQKIKDGMGTGRGEGGAR